MNWKKNLWKLFTIIVVISLVMNPETFVLGLFIDAVSLEIYFLLVEIQLIAIGGYIFQSQIKPLLTFLNGLISRLDPFYFVPTRDIIIKYPPIILHMIPGLVCIYWVLIIQAG